MRVLVTIFERLVPSSGGGTPRISNIIKALVKKGHEVFVACSLGVEKEDAMRTLGCVDLLPLLYVSRLGKRKMMKYMYAHPINILRVVKYMKKVKPDIIISHNSIAGFAGVIAKKYCRVNCITALDLTDLLFEYLEDYSSKKWIKLIQFLGRKLEKKTLLNSDKIITISNSMRDILLTYGVKKDNIETVYDGVDTDIFRKADKSMFRHKYGKDAASIVIFQGVIDPQDEPQIIVDAAKEVLKKHADAMFWIIGNGTAIPELKERISNYKLEDRFYFSGWVNQEEVVKYISGSDIGLVILPDVLSARGRVTLKEFEYWACGIPVVAPRLPALEEVVQENETGLFYEPGNSKNLADKINLLTEDKEFRKKMGENGMKMVKEIFEWKKLAENFVKKCENYKLEVSL